MIHIERGQKVTDNENIFVSSITGDYEDNALIEFYSSDNPEKILGAFAAQYVKYGNIVYQFSDPKELGAEILKLDPESTHTAASFVRMQNELLKQFNQGDLEAESLTQVLADEQANMTDQIENDPNATTTEPVNTDNTTTTQPVVNDQETQNQTPATSTNNGIPIEQILKENSNQNISTTSLNQAMSTVNVQPAATSSEILSTSTQSITSSDASATSSNPIANIVDQIFQDLTTSTSNSTQSVPTSTAIESVIDASSSAPTIINSTSTGI